MSEGDDDEDFDTEIAIKPKRDKIGVQSTIKYHL